MLSNRYQKMFLFIWHLANVIYVGRPDTDPKGVPMDTIINLTNDQLVANAMRKMGWNFDVASDTLIKAFGRYEGEDLLVALWNMGYFG